jgi:hypothetical protein
MDSRCKRRRKKTKTMMMPPLENELNGHRLKAPFGYLYSSASSSSSSAAASSSPSFSSSAAGSSSFLQQWRVKCSRGK